MKLAAQLQGQNDPFEGDRTLYIAGLPEGAQIVRASVRAQPELCTQEIIFNNGRGNWGATKELATPPVNSVAVDLHTRRTITHFRASATPAGSVNVQVDIGGVWARLAQDGTISPADENDVLAYALTPTPTRQALPPLTAQRLRLSTGAAAQNLDIQQLTVVSQPTNVQVRLDEMPPFWAKPGELSAPASSPDFAELLQTYLAEAVVEDGFYVIPLVVHSDSIACLSVTVEIEYLNQQSALPPGVAETKLTFDYGSLPKAEANLLEITLPVGARVIPGATTAQVTGAFAESRVVFGPTGEVTPEPQVLVNPGQSQAQPIQLGTNVAATAIDLLLAAQTRVAKLTLNLLGDTDGKPSNEPLLSAPVSIDLDREVAGSPTWISASLPVEFQFAAGVRYWLMLQSREGDALWSVHAESEAQIGLHFTNSGGLAWRATTANNLTAPVAAFFRLRHTTDRFQMPIELQIGVGDNAQRVSLARFEPLGRVDFQLDFDEVAAAINQFVEQASPPQSPQVEHLFNGDYTEWSVVGRKIMHPLATPTAQLLSPVAIAVSPGGQMLYVGGERPTLDDVGSEPPVTVGVVHFVATDCMTLAAEIVLPDATPLEMVVDPLRERLFVLAEGSTSAQTHRLFVIDTTQRTLIGDFHELNFEVNAIAISPDGFRLYLAGRAQTACNLLGHVRVVDTERLINALVSPAPANAPVSIADITLGEQHNPLALAVSPDGLFVYVATFNSLAGAGAQFGEIHVIHAATNSLAEEFIPVGDTLLDLAVTPDGAQIVAIGTETLPSEDEAGQVYFVNVRNGDVTPLLGALDATVLALPTSLGITPDGQRCLVADETTESLVIIDRARRRIEQTLPLSAHPTDLTLTQMGDWAYLPTATLAQLLPVAGNRDGLVAVPLGAPVPMEWTLTAGSVVPICFAEPFHRTAVLGLSAETHEPADTDSSLSQVVAVAPACTYEFNFWGRAIEAGAIAEIIWLGDGCGLLGVERLPVAVAQLPPANFAPSLPSGAETQPTLELHRLRVQSPAGAAQAEIRFSTPAGVVAVLDQVSLRGVLGVVQNGDFQVLEDGQLATWMLSPANATAVSVIAEADETRIQNQGRGQAALLQRFPVTPEQQFLLVAVGHNGGAQNAGVTPQLEVHWLKSDGA
jgi:DNA-binding beta-propeller fold protein YncE